MEKLYAKLPIFLQNIACSIYGYRERKNRFNGIYDDQLSLLLASQWATSHEVKHQLEQNLRHTLEHAQRRVPYYRKLFAQYQVSPNATDIFAELRKLPILSKEDLRANETLLLDDSVSRNQCIELHTSGTTAKALTLFKSPESVAQQWAIWFRHRDRFDCHFGDLHVNFTGKPVVPLNQKKPPFWRYNRAFNQYLINMQHVNERNIEAIVGFLNSISPRFYSGYPSIMAEVARIALHKGLALAPSSRPAYVFGGAENTLDYQKEALQLWTGAVVTDQYGLTEGNCNLSKCKEGVFHLDHEFGYVECIDPEDLGDGRKRGKLVGTGFSNTAMPLIRYDTGDVAIWASESYRCPCGLETPVIESIEGRIDDFVELPDGRRIMRFDYLFKGTDEIKEAQVCQYKKGEVVFKLVVRNGRNLALEDELKAQFVKWITDDMAVRFEYVDVIPKTKSGKFKAVQSFLSQ